MTKNVVEAIADFKGGNAVRFTDIYSLTEATQGRCKRFLRKKLPATITDADISAIYDDALLQSVETFTGETDEEFEAYVYRASSSAGIDLLRKTNAEKRKANTGAISINSKVGTDETVEIADIVADTTKEHPDSLLACEDIIACLTAFRGINNKTREYADLIAFDTMLFPTKADKHDAMRGILGKDVTSSAIHKKLGRAKKSFREYLEENY